MKTFDASTGIERIVADARARAGTGTYGGRRRTEAYFERCQTFHEPTGTKLILTRDANMHGSGWWKNPDYERCWHLSLSFWGPAHVIVDPWAPVDFRPRGRDVAESRRWVRVVFGRDRRWLWCEPPVSAAGLSRDVWHYRLFCDEGWQPIKPRGEVYNRDLTPAGWLSWSDARAAEATELASFQRELRP